MRKIATTSKDMGVTRDAVLRWLNVLRKGGYIETVNTVGLPTYARQIARPDGSAIDALTGELWGSSTFPPISKKKFDDGRTRPRMNGRAVFVHAVRRVREVVQECLDANGLLAFAKPAGVLSHPNVAGDEVRSLLDGGYSAGLRPMTGHGYAEAARHLSGAWSLDQAVEVTARRTRQYRIARQPVRTIVTAPTTATPYTGIIL